MLRRASRGRRVACRARLGVADEYLYFDEGLTGKNRNRPGFENALKAVRPGDMIVVTELDRFGRSARDLGDIAKELDERGITLSLGGKPYDPKDPMDKLFFGMHGLFAESERNLVSARTKDARPLPERRKNGRSPTKTLCSAEKQALRLNDVGEHTPSEIDAMFGESLQDGVPRSGRGTRRASYVGATDNPAERSAGVSSYWGVPHLRVTGRGVL